MSGKENSTDFRDKIESAKAKSAGILAVFRAFLTQAGAILAEIDKRNSFSDTP